jgi:hypothetical protein
MSWVNIIKNDLSDKPKIINKPKELIPKIDTKGKYDFSNEDFFDLFYGSELLNDCITIRFNCEKYTPWLLTNIDTIELYDFIYQFVNLECYNNDILDDSEIEDIDEDYMYDNE